MSTRNVFSFALLAILILVSVSAKDDDNPDGSRLTGEAEETKRVAGESPVRSESLVKGESLAAGILRRKKKSAAFIADWKKSIMGMLPSGRGKRSAYKAVAAAAVENQIRLTDAQVDAEWRRSPARR